MDGYASSVAAMQVDGVKVTYPARAPGAIFADPRVCAAAPAELTRAGIGDLLGKATARRRLAARPTCCTASAFDRRRRRGCSAPLTFAAAERGAACWPASRGAVASCSTG